MIFPDGSRVLRDAILPRCFSLLNTGQCPVFYVAPVLSWSFSTKAALSLSPSTKEAGGIQFCSAGATKRKGAEIENASCLRAGHYLISFLGFGADLLGESILICLQTMQSCDVP